MLRTKKLRPIHSQVVVVVGASSGMGRVTALRFAEGGAKVAVAARNRAALDSLVAEIEQGGGTATAFECDVGEFAQVEALADSVMEHFGRIDTWAHFSATTVYAPFQQTSAEEFEQVIRVNLLGQAYGAMAALPALRRQGGGALIFISSIEGEVALPYHSAYAASKHGLNGLIDALRLELAHDQLPISVTTVMPTAVNTPFFSNARTKLGVKPKPAGPIYQPEHVADAVLYAAEHPVRELFVGGGAKMVVMGKRLMPRAVESYLLATAFRNQRTNEPKSDDAPSGLYAPETGDDRVHGDFTHLARKHSLYTWMQTHPTAAWLCKAAGLLALAGWAAGCCRGGTLDRVDRRGGSAWPLVRSKRE